MNRLLVMAVSRWFANTAVVYLLASGGISPADRAGWTDTFVNLSLGLISLGMLLWTIAQNRWPSLVKLTASLPEVEKVFVTSAAASFVPTVADHPDVAIGRR